jgi:hypothetical protein
MGKFRKTVQKSFYEILDRSVFTSEDFKVTFGDPDKNQYIVHIVFIHDTNFKFSIGKQQLTLGHSVTRSPGTIMEQDTSYHPFDDAKELIIDWCREISHELRASKPIYRELDELKAIITEQLSASMSDSDEFSVEEINDLRKSFAELKARVEKLEKDQIITEKQLQEFSVGLSEVDDEIDYYPKKTWVKTASNKLVKIVSSIGKSQEGRKMLADGARKLLGID